MRAIDLARDPSTPSSRLHELAETSPRDEIKRAVASNPNASLKTLEILLQRYPREVSNNPAMLMYLQTEMWAIRDWSYAHFLFLRDAPDAVIPFLAQMDHDVGRALIGNVNTRGQIHPDAFAIMADDLDEEMGESLASNEDTPSEVLAKIWKENEHVFELVLVHPNMTHEIADAMSRSPIADDYLKGRIKRWLREHPVREENPPRVDLTGQTIGIWTVLGPAPDRLCGGKKVYFWRVSCPAGHEKESRSIKLSANCEICNRKYQSISVDDVIGEWTVLAPSDVIDVRGNKYWSCKCSCGEERDVSDFSLRRGSSKSCGHAAGGGGRYGERRQIESAEKYFFDRIDRVDDHWIWIGSFTDGRPVMSRPAGQWIDSRQARHVSLEVVGRSAPIWSRIRSTCGEPRCVRPEHLEIVSSGATSDLSPEEEAADVLELAREGVSAEEIASSLGLELVHVEAILVKNKAIEITTEPAVLDEVSDADRQKILAYKAEGWTPEDVAELMDMDVATVKRAIKGRESNPAPANLVGQTFGPWTVLDRVPGEKDRGVTWRVTCQQGHERTYTTAQLKAGKVSECRQCQTGYPEDLSGMVLGEWSVLNFEQQPGSRRRSYRCKCSCGEERIVLEQSLVSGTSTSCGHEQRIAPEDLSGMPFGEWTAIGKSARTDPTGKTLWWCRCSCGEEREVSRNSLVSGKSLSCGHRTITGHATRLGIMGPSRDLADRFWSRIRKIGDHWIWQGQSMILEMPADRTGKRGIRVSRAAMMVAGRPLATTEYAIPTCDERQCVAPDHQMIVSRGEFVAWREAGGEPLDMDDETIEITTEPAVRDEVSDADRQKILAYKAEGWSPEDVAELMDMDVATVKRAIKGRESNPARTRR